VSVNYWRFSWRAANYGGGSLLLAYLVWFIITAFVLAVAEYAIGKIGRGVHSTAPTISLRGIRGL
jgi:SNF family Na+-dependent transporter